MRLSTTRRRAALAATSAGIVAAAIAGVAAGVPALAAPEDAEPTSLVEDFSYPDAASYPDIKLIRGDGRILIVDCDAGRTSAEVWSFTRPTPFCFEFKGDNGFVSLELADVYGIRNNENFAMSAKVTVDETTKVVEVPEVDWKGVGVGAGENQAVLLELRA
ncbi:hypothetical protein [Spirilliplanes yamanashiensis]|uniref:Secreted protein n=1 Tax=Spirilliplanes yamanashiensis TaxID=42233 RepID=A0A8J3Y9K9_9ACTN|nr:hypothetical protein [Spirilliplanes yamanashiensis]MDP9815474.1 hypothetical protein [Spirilliplanes yamanashiensis]GIJ03728.1 hypothetical protein Sya03_30800 [Spirilliplanes yamanashiensis]